jgi:predicted metal-dependent peptidase
VVDRVVDVLEEFANNRTLLRMRLPFLSVFARVLDEENLVELEERGTMGVNSKSLFYCKHFGRRLTSRQFRGVVLHELYHVVLGHYRRGTLDKDVDYDQRLMNMAMDLRINSDLCRFKNEYARLGIRYDLLDIGLYPRLDGYVSKENFDINSMESLEGLREGTLDTKLMERYSEMSAEEIYGELKHEVKSQKSKNKNKDEGNGGGNGGGKGRSGEDLGGQREGMVRVAGNKAEIGKDGRLISGGQDNHDELMGEGGLDRQELDAVYEGDFRMAERIQGMTAGGCGDLPGSLKNEIFRMHDVKLDWKMVYERLIKKLVGGEVSYKRVQRWGVHSGTYVPSQVTSKKIQSMVFVGVDTSGSMSKEVLELFFGALVRISKRYAIHESCEVGFWDCVMGSTYGLAKSVRELSGGSVSFKISRGGTNVMSYFDYLIGRYNKREIDPEVILVFTDGEFETSKLVDKIPKRWHRKILWVVWGRYNKKLDSLGVGKVVHINA